METAALRICGVSASYGATRALVDVSFDVGKGRVHALLGGNGSGKSTLIKVLAGVASAETAGEIVRDPLTGPVAATAITPALARDMGLRFVHQDLPIFPDLSIAENLAIGSGFDRHRSGGIAWKRLRVRTAEILDRFGLDARPTDRAATLHPTARTMLAIVRALHGVEELQDAVLVLDEPTAALPREEVRNLLAAMRDLTSRGLTILWVSHRLDEVVQAADDVTVLRDGRHQGTAPLGDRTTVDLGEMIVGRAVRRTGRTETSSNDRPVVLQVDGLSAGPVADVSFELRDGEIVGLVGLTGSGRSTVLRSLMGLQPRAGGDVLVDGRPVRPGRVRQAMELGLRYLPEERRQIAFADMSVAMNASAPHAARYWRGLLDRRAEHRDGQDLIAALGVRASSASAPLSSLSGGNQQKVLVGSAIRSRPRALLVDEPTQGVDVGAREDIHALIRAAVSDGGCALVVSSDLDELASLCHRVLVLAEGRVVNQISGDDLSEAAIAHELDKGVVSRGSSPLDHLVIGENRAQLAE